MYNDGIIIGLRNKINKYKKITKKFLANEELNQEERDFLEKEGLIQ